MSSDIVKGESVIRFTIHEMAYLMKGIGERIQKYENMVNRNSDDEASYQFTLWLRDKVEYCRNAALPS